MKPLLYDKTGTIKLGELTNCIECLVEEERNGLFEVSLIYPANDTLFNSLEEENIIVCNANDTLLNQKFRIYMTRKLMSNRIEVFARHISFDLAYDYINSIDIENQSCEYTLNTIFRNSQFSTHYKGYSDIINAQDYKISKVNCIEAIGGTSGSILDTFGTGAEILRDNTNIHVLNKRGYDNGVSIEYAKNLTGFELEEDYSELITRIIPFATYSDSESNEEILVEANAVDSDLISNYSHPYVSYIDFSDEFEDEEIPTTEKLINLANKYFKDNECDKPKQNFKIEFIPLSKCVGYEGIQDNISLCDTVTIKDTRYNINTKAKVIKTVFNVLKNKYESMELGEPRTTLGDIINFSGSGEDGKQGPPGPQGPPGADGSIGDFPNSLPSTPVLSANVYGFASIELNWTYENKVYYNYELYASKTKDFTPNTFDLIHAGQTSSFLFQAKPNETWHFRVCAVNTHGERTPFSAQITVNTTKIDDLSNYVQNQAINEALIGTLSLDRGWVGTLKGNYIDAKQLSVTNGNGVRTLDIDSYGNVNLNVNSLKISSSNVATENYANNQANTSLSNAKTYTDNVGKSTLTSANTHANSVANTAQTNAINSAKDYTNTKITDVKAELKVTTDSITQRVSSTESKLTTTTNKIDNLQIGGRNLILDSKKVIENSSYYINTYAIADQTTMVQGDTYTISFDGKLTDSSQTGFYINVYPSPFPGLITLNRKGKDSEYHHYTGTFTLPNNSSYTQIGIYSMPLGNYKLGGVKNVKVEKGNKATDYTPASEDVDSSIASVDSKVQTTNNKVASIETNLNGIAQRVSSTETTTSALTTTVETVKTTANNASTNANNALDKVNTASANATTALNTANNAKDTASSASTKADNAVSTANTAKSTADKAQVTANSANTLANTANTTANTNKNNITALQTTVATTNNKVAELTTNLDGITQRVSSTESKLTTTTNKIDTLEVGGRNLLLNSRHAYENSSYYINTYTIADKTSMISGEAYTISFDGMLSDSSQTGFYINVFPSPYTQLKIISRKGSDGEYYRYTATFTLPSNNNSHTAIGVYTHPLDNKKLGGVKNIKLEKGNKATDWTPAPEDIETTVSNLTTRVSTAESKLTKDSLTTTIGSYYTTSSDVNGIVTSKGYATTSQVQQTKNELTAQFNNGYSQGITKINKDGIQVSQSNISTTTKMNASGFYIQKTDGTNIFKVDSSGLSFNGAGTFTGSVNTNNIIYANGGIYTKQDIKGTNTDGTGLSVYTDSGDVAIRTNGASNSVYLQPKSGEVKVTYPKEPSNYADIRFKSCIAHEMLYSHGDVRGYKVYANGVALTSDKTLKEDIQYLSKDIIELSENDDNITSYDMYNFIRNDLQLAKYKYKGKDDIKIGLIAQDLQDTKIGEKILTTIKSIDTKEAKLGYDIDIYVNVLAGALQTAIDKIEEQNKLIAELSKKINNNEGLLK